METTELLEILNGIFRKVLKRDDITLTESTTAMMWTDGIH